MATPKEGSGGSSLMDEGQGPRKCGPSLFVNSLTIRTLCAVSVFCSSLNIACRARRSGAISYCVGPTSRKEMAARENLKVRALQESEPEPPQDRGLQQRAILL